SAANRESDRASIHCCNARHRRKAHRRGWLVHPRTWRCASQGPRGPFLFPKQPLHPRSSTMSKEMTGAEMVIEALADQGVEHLFGYPGGAVLPIYDALFHQKRVQHILVRHEQ